MEVLPEFTEEYFEELGKRMYERDRKCPENFSNWYRQIQDFGYFSHANIVSNQILLYEEMKEFEEEIETKVDWEKIRKILQPTLDRMENNRLYSIKNGCFSNKFDFETCITTKEDLAKKLWQINYVSSIFETGGKTELVVREYIGYDKESIATIYNGMPLREEVRVFYNMDRKQIEYMVDYWDYDYCRKELDLTDSIVFDWFHNKIAGRNKSHCLVLENMKTIICEKINTLKFKGLEGIWSIDFMLEDNKIYLIDMARGFRSAYWNPDKLKKEEV